MKIVVTGGRDKKDFKNVKLVHDVLDPFRFLIDKVFVGDADGVDKTTRKMFLDAIVYHANWDLHGNAAGPIRNREMLEAAGKDAIVIAFPGGRGTENCVKQAKELGMIVLRVEL